jgi:tRNA G18 (ribose-2'-O)-methylase SpoU
MLRLEKITALDRPELEPYRTLKRSAEHEKLGIFVVEGDKVLHRLLDSNFTIVSVLLVEDRLGEFEPRLQSRPEADIQVFVCTKAGMTELAGFEIYQGVLAVARMPAPLTLADILKIAPSPRLLVAVDGLSNAENMGLLMRNCAAFGVAALITGETCCSPFLRRTARNSMGTLFKLPVMASPNLVKTLQELRWQGVHCIAAHPHTDKKVLSQADFTGDSCLVFGSEGDGISPAVLAACNEAVAVPMANEVDSLNVGAAAAVFLYEATRQRGKA